MINEEVIIIGAGPCGLSCALELQSKGINPLIIEKGNIVNTIYNFPTHQTFFSTSRRLEIGGFPFVNDRIKPVRNEALAYYREVVKRKNIRIHSFERVVKVEKLHKLIQITSKTLDGETVTYHAKNVIIATGYYDQPRLMNVPGENLPKVMHYFKEAHPYYNKDVVVIGGKNSAIDTALELHKVGARVTVLTRGSEYSKSIKPWILPEFEALVENNKIKMFFNANVTNIGHHKVDYQIREEKVTIKNDFVFAMTGYQPDMSLLQKIGIRIDENSGKPEMNPHTFETNIKNIYLAGVVISGYNTNETFIENGRLHGAQIVQAMLN